MPPKCKFTREEITKTALDLTRAEGIDALTARYAEYIQAGLHQKVAFQGVGTQYIQFAIQEPKLFQLLFMSEQPQKPSVAGILPIIDESYGQILQSVQSGYELDVKDAENLYRHLWIYAHGIAVLCATNMCSFTAEEVEKMMSEVFLGLLQEIKGEPFKDETEDK